MTTWQAVIVGLVIAARLVVPLAIPRFPVPALVGSFVLDAVDQTIFQTINAVPGDYESYDKALDIYYLAIAYASTLRNWGNHPALQIARFLFYYRLVGTAAFELTDYRPLLLIFPNTFEYFFLAYEVIRTRWRPGRLSTRTLVAMAAGIWIVVKLPQEYWLHVARLDLTDEAAAHPRLALVVTAVLVVAGIALWSQRDRLPRADWPATVDVDRHLDDDELAGPTPQAVRRMGLWGTVLEKAVLLSLIVMIFAQVLPIDATATQISLSITLIVALNGLVSLAFAMRGQSWQSMVGQFAAMLTINAGLVLVLRLLRGRIEATSPLDVTLFVLILLSLLITLFDRYRIVEDRRMPGHDGGVPVGP